MEAPQKIYKGYYSATSYSKQNCIYRYCQGYEGYKRLCDNRSLITFYNLFNPVIGPARAMLEEDTQQNNNLYIMGRFQILCALPPLLTPNSSLLTIRNLFHLHVTL